MLKLIDMQKPLIGVTAGEIYNRDYPWAPVTHGQRHTFLDSVIRAGGAPIITPLTKDREVLHQIADRLDGLLLSGGNDIHPKQYGEEPYETLIDLSDLRDETEKFLLKHALEKGIPILGLCRGHQFINIYFGGTLYQDLPRDLPEAMDHEHSNKEENIEHKAHIIEIEKGSKLHNLLGEDKVYTNTHHHQAVKELGKGLRITARSDKDGVIEGIETDDNRFIIGIQGHPESLNKAVPVWENLFAGFVDAARSGTLVAK